MVKGNWECRAERENIRRVAARVKKASRGSPDSVTAESVARSLLSSEKLRVYDSNSRAWVAMTESNKMCCQWFRTETCNHKKCHLSHRITIADLRNAPGDGALRYSSDERGEPAVECFFLRNVAEADYCKIHYLAVEDSLVFDYRCSNVWATWRDKRLQAMQRGKLASVDESGEDMTDNIKVEGYDEKDNNAAPTQESHSRALESFNEFETMLTISGRGSLLELLPSETFDLIISFCHVKIFGTLSMSCIFLKNYFKMNPLARSRKKEHLSEIAKSTSKKRKEEKKKRAKNAHIKKNTKKDGYARGQGFSG